MSKGRRRIIQLACGILAVGLGWALLAPREPEPSYRGRTLSQLLKDIDQGRWGCWDDAPIRAIGVHALPTFLKWISYEEPPLRNRIAKLVEFLSPTLARRLTQNPWGRSNRVICVFRILGPQARAAIPELTRLAQTAIPPRADGSKPGRAPRCIDCLGFIGLEALPGLLSLATNSPTFTRLWAINKLADFGPNAAAAVPALRLASTNTHPYVRDAARQALLKIAPGPILASGLESHARLEPSPTVVVDMPSSPRCDGPPLRDANLDQLGFGIEDPLPEKFWLERYHRSNGVAPRCGRVSVSRLYGAI